MGCAIAIYGVVLFLVLLYENYIFGGILILIPVGLTIYYIVGSIQDRKDEKERKIKRKLLREKKKEELQNITIPAYNNARAELISKYGEPAKSINIMQFEKYSLEKEIIAFEASEIIWICGKLFPMKSILNCTLDDNQTIVKGDITSSTKTKDGNMAKRAVVGSVLMGGAGAVIGGATAKKSTVTKGGLVEHATNTLL